MMNMNRFAMNTANANTCACASSAAENNVVVVIMDTVMAVSIFVISIISLISLRLYGLIIMLIMGTTEYFQRQKCFRKIVFR